MKKGGNLFHISYEMSSDGRADTRTVYTFFDVLGDAGGLLALLAAVASLFLHVVNFNKAENAQVSELYKPATAEADDSDKEENPQPEQQSSLKSWFFATFPECLYRCCIGRCCKYRRRDSFYDKGQEHLQEE